jgi:hypothetical protein
MRESNHPGKASDLAMELRWKQFRELYLRRLDAQLHGVAFKTKRARYRVEARMQLLELTP